MKIGNSLGKTRDVSDTVPEKFKDLQSKSKIECELCGGITKLNNVSMKESLVWE